MTNKQNVITPETLAEELERAIALRLDADIVAIARKAVAALQRLPTQNEIAPETVAELYAAMVNALDGHTKYSRDCHMSGEFLTSKVWPLVEAALRIPTQSTGETDESAYVDGYRQGKYDAIRDAQSKHDPKVSPCPTCGLHIRKAKPESENVFQVIAHLQDALERIALLDEADGHELTVDHAFHAVAIATKVLGKHPSEIDETPYINRTRSKHAPFSQGGEAILQNDLRELLLILDLGDHARPQSPHDVFQQCLIELRRRLPPAQGGQSPRKTVKPFVIEDDCVNVPAFYPIVVCPACDGLGAIPGTGFGAVCSRCDGAGKLPILEWSANAVAHELQERLTLKYIGDCKCGQCALVPDELIRRAIAALRSPAIHAPAQGG